MKWILALLVLVVAGCSSKDHQLSIPKDEVLPITSHTHSFIDNSFKVHRIENDEVICYTTGYHAMQCKWKNDESKPTTEESVH